MADQKLAYVLLFGNLLQPLYSLLQHFLVPVNHFAVRARVDRNWSRKLELSEIFVAEGQPLRLVEVDGQEDVGGRHLLDTCRTTLGQLLDTCRTTVGHLLDELKPVERFQAEALSPVGRFDDDRCLVVDLTNRFNLEDDGNNN
jgi:hypothetical protein